MDEWIHRNIKDLEASKVVHCFFDNKSITQES